MFNCLWTQPKFVWVIHPSEELQYRSPGSNVLSFYIFESEISKFIKMILKLFDLRHLIFFFTANCAYILYGKLTSWIKHQLIGPFVESFWNIFIFRGICNMQKLIHSVGSFSFFFLFQTKIANSFYSKINDWSTKGFLYEIFGTVRQKIFDGKSWYSPPPPSYP